MVVLAELVGAFILRAVVPKLVLDDQAAVEQEVDGVVECGTTDAVLVVFHLVVQRVDVKMSIGGVNLLEDGKTFWGLPQFPPLKVIDEYLLDGQIGIVKRVFHSLSRVVGAKIGNFWKLFRFGVLFPFRGVFSDDFLHVFHAVQLDNQVVQFLGIVDVNGNCGFHEVVFGLHVQRVQI